MGLGVRFFVTIDKIGKYQLILVQLLMAYKMMIINIIYEDQPTKNRIFNPIKKMQRRIYFCSNQNIKMKLNYLEQVLLYIRNSVLFLFSASILMAQVSTTVDKSEKNDGAKVELNKFVVTGVFNGINKQQAKTAISTLDFSDIEKIIPVSALDLLSFVPGVQVNTAQGIVRGAIRSRGLNGNTQTFISIMEDGLPVTATTYDNYAHDYFLRADSTIGQLEVLRGGSAAVFGPNAPGGIFNYISKTGGEFYSGQVSASYGLQGNGTLPYYRTDYFIMWVAIIKMITVPRMLDICQIEVDNLRLILSKNSRTGLSCFM